MMKIKQNSLFLLLLLAIGAGFLIMSLNLSLAEDKVAPILFGGVLIVLVIIELGRDLGSKKDLVRPKESENKGQDGQKIIPSDRIPAIVVWLAGPILGFCLLGFHVTIPLFVFLYIKLHGRGWFIATIMAVVTTAFFVGICDYALRIGFYEGLIFELLE